MTTQPATESFSLETVASIAYARQLGVGDLPRRTTARFPDKLALVAERRRVSFAAFDAVINRCANALAARGLAKGDRLALLSHNCVAFVVLAFATARLGIVLVPINFMLGAEEIAFILRHSGARGMVSEDGLARTADKAMASAELRDGLRSDRAVRHGAGRRLGGR
jgi:fatty-acyl-CoA synthase